MDQTTIFYIGIFVFFLLAIGAALTIDEFRKMEENPEKYHAPVEKEDEEKDQKK